MTNPSIRPYMLPCLALPCSAYIHPSLRLRHLAWSHLRDTKVSLSPAFRFGFGFRFLFGFLTQCASALLFSLSLPLCPPAISCVSDPGPCTEPAPPQKVNSLPVATQGSLPLFLSLSLSCPPRAGELCIHPTADLLRCRTL